MQGVLHNEVMVKTFGLSLHIGLRILNISDSVKKWWVRHKVSVRGRGQSLKG